MLPKRALTDSDIRKFAQENNITHFRGVYMRDGLPFLPLRVECAVVNLDSKIGPGTHWVAYFKKNNIVKYFDSFGNLGPPLELLNYFNRRKKVNVTYNYNRYQDYNEINCGHLCLEFLMRNID